MSSSRPHSANSRLVAAVSAGLLVGLVILVQAPARAQTPRATPNTDFYAATSNPMAPYDQYKADTAGCPASGQARADCFAAATAKYNAAVVAQQATARLNPQSTIAQGVPQRGALLNARPASAPPKGSMLNTKPAPAPDTGANSLRGGLQADRSATPSNTNTNINNYQQKLGGSYTPDARSPFRPGGANRAAPAGNPVQGALDLYGAAGNAIQSAANGRVPTTVANPNAPSNANPVLTGTRPVGGTTSKTKGAYPKAPLPANKP